MIVIVSDNDKENVGTALYDYYKMMDLNVEFISASNRHIKPCYGCNGCTYVTYGKCVHRDDMDQILPTLIKGETIIYVSPLLWGGFSYNIKKILDKTSLMGDRFYQVENKELVKGTIGNIKKIVGVGVSERRFNSRSKKEQGVFKNLLREIAMIMNIDYMGIIVDTMPTKDEIKMLAMEVLL